MQQTSKEKNGQLYIYWNLAYFRISDRNYHIAVCGIDTLLTTIRSDGLGMSGTLPNVFAARTDEACPGPT